MAKAAWKFLLPYKGESKSITTDNGIGFAGHKRTFKG